MTIHLDDAFQLPVPPDRAWEVLNDVPRIAHCMPGATAIETVGPTDWTARIEMKIGPMSMEFDATIHSECVSMDERIARLTVVATETKGKGGARAIVLSTVIPEATGDSAVSLSTDVSFDGPMGRHLRGPIVTSISRQMTARFARSLQAELAKPPESSDEEVVERPETSAWLRSRTAIRSWAAAVGGLFNRQEGT